MVDFPNNHSLELSFDKEISPLFLLVPGKFLEWGKKAATLFDRILQEQQKLSLAHLLILFLFEFSWIGPLQST